MCVWCSAGEDWLVDLLSLHRATADTSANNISDDFSLLHQIRANFTAASELYAGDVGGLCWVESLQIHVAFFVLNDATDRDEKVRSRLPGGPQIHRCDINTVCFTQTHVSRAASTAFEREREFSNLCSFLGTVLYRRVCVFPSEQLLCLDSGASVCDRLRQRLLTSGTNSCSTQTAASLVFVCRTSSSCVVHSQLLRRVLSYAQDQLLTAQHGVYIVADVGLNVRLSELHGVLEPPTSSIHMAVYSGAKPLFSPISCIVIALHLSST